MRLVDEAFAGHIIIAIAHRLDTIFGFDRIAVFHDGVLAKFDSPENLLRKDNGAFKALWTHSQEY